MLAEDMQLPEAAISKAEAREVVIQIADLITQVLDRRVTISRDGEELSTSTDVTEAGHGIVSVSSENLDAHIRVRLELVRATEPLLLHAHAWAHLATLTKHRVYLLEPEDAGEPNALSVRVYIDVRARRMSYERQQMLSGAIKACQEAAISLQRDLPVPRPDGTILGPEFGPIAELVHPVAPWTTSESGAAKLRYWASENIDYLRGRSSLAVTASQSIAERIAQALLADAARSEKFVLVRTRVAMTAKMLTDLVEKLPQRSALVVPARSINLASNRYDVAGEAAVMLDLLRERQTPVVFIGDESQLQRALAGGPGGRSDALHPISSQTPDIPLRVAVRFAVETTVSHTRAPARWINDVSEQVLRLLSRPDVPDPLAIISATVNWVLTAMAKSYGPVPLKAAQAFVGKLTAKRTGLGGLTAPRSQGRASYLQQKYQRLAAPGLLQFLVDRVHGQTRALQETTERLRSEVRSRPLHQPLRALLVGPPGVGKSRLCELIAEYVGVKYQHLNLGGMESAHSVIAELKGAPPGYVGSDAPGFLEKAAKTARESGLVLEIADLDHTSFEVRRAVTSLLLGPLDAGFFQVASGIEVSCAGMIIVVTTNLPGNADERINMAPGFIPPTSDDVRERVITTLKEATDNNAVLSRLGTPIVLDPLPQSAFPCIVESEIRTALELGFASSGVSVSIEVVSGTGAALLARKQPRGLITLGARGLQELARGWVMNAIDELLSAAPIGKRKRLRLRAKADAGGSLTITLR